MSRRDQVFQALNSVQDHVYNYLDTHAGPSSPPPTAPAPSQAQSEAALPLYGTDRGSGDPLPDEVLNAPPGQAQQAADQMATTRMARGDAREARKAAGVLRKEQMKTGQVKKRHTFASSNGRMLLHIDSIPQRTLTYMGGTAERGRGAMKGKVVVHAQEGERISAIRLKIKAVVRVVVPRAGEKGPVLLDQADPIRQGGSERELLLLQLESKLYSTPSTTLPAGSTSFDPTLLASGTYEYPFSMDIPSQASKKGQPLPPSFVLSPTTPPAKGFRALAGVTPDWASVKWYAKVTVERPGIFRANERIFAPFVYLPPPPSMNGMEEQLERRSKLAIEVDGMLRKLQTSNGRASLEQIVEPVSTWREIPLNHGIGRKGAQNPSRVDEKSGEEEPGLFSRLLFGSQASGPVSPSKETFSLSIPKYVFPLRSGIPFVIHRQVEWKGPVAPDLFSKVPTVALLQRTNIAGRAKGQVAGTTVRVLATSRCSPRPASSWQDEPKGRGKTQVNRQAESWLGMVDLPPTCTPCFDTPLLSLDYYLSVRVGQEVLHSEPVVLCCPPSRPVARPSAPARRQSSTPVQPSRTHTTASRPARQEPEVKRTGAGRPLIHDSVPSRPSSAVSAARPSVPPSSSTVASSSRTRPPAPLPSVPPAIDEKRALALPPRPPPQQQPILASPVPVPATTPAPAPAPASGPTPPTRFTPAPSRTPSEAGTHDDDSDAGDDPNQWLFHEDELTDLPPSYFEATGADHDD